MQKIKHYLFIISCILFSFVGIASATESTGTSSAWNAVTYDSTIEFNAVLNSSGNIEATWSKYNKSDNFTYYKLVRSSSVTSPVYPENGYIYYSSDVNSLSYVDNSVPAGTSYYRICQIASPNRYCSEKVVTINNNITAVSACSYSYSVWSACTNGKQTRTLTKPVACTEAIPEALERSCTTTDLTPQIKLTGTVSDKTINLSWNLISSSIKTFKVVWGKSQNPVYPNRETDSYHYFSAGETTDSITGLDNGKYYIRVCIYENGVCTKYSNEIIAEINNASDSFENPNTVVACNDIYSPVCGNNNKTYSNACNAKKNGITNYVSGKCADTTTDKASSLGITFSKPLDQMDRDELIRTLITILISLLSKQ